MHETPIAVQQRDDGTFGLRSRLTGGLSVHRDIAALWAAVDELDGVERRRRTRRRTTDPGPQLGRPPDMPWRWIPEITVAMTRQRAVDRGDGDESNPAYRYARGSGRQVPPPNLALWLAAGLAGWVVRPGDSGAIDGTESFPLSDPPGHPTPPS